MPIWEFKCPNCGRVFEHVSACPQARVAKCECGVAAARQPSAPAFTIKGFSAKNGYSK